MAHSLLQTTVTSYDENIFWHQGRVLCSETKGVNSERNTLAILWSHAVRGRGEALIMTKIGYWPSRRMPRHETRFPNEGWWNQTWKLLGIYRKCSVQGLNLLVFKPSTSPRVLFEQRPLSSMRIGRLKSFGTCAIIVQTCYSVSSWQIRHITAFSWWQSGIVMAHLFFIFLYRTTSASAVARKRSYCIITDRHGQVHG